MENRFGIKDLFLFLLISVLIILVVLAMVQYDRQWERVKVIQAKLDDQAETLHKIESKLSSGFALAPPTSGPTTAADSGDDPFARDRAAAAMPGYARGDWLVDSLAGNTAKLTPLLSLDLYASNIQSFVLESLATRDPETLGWKPLLARDWTISEDGLKIAFRMRTGVTFSDGHPLTAADVVFTYRWAMDEKINAPRARVYLQTIDKVEQTGPDEVTFVFKEPYFKAFELAASFQVMPEHFYGKFTPQQFNDSVGLLLGSGAYRLEDPTSWKPGTQVQLVRNERYWGFSPALERLAYREITNDTARLSAFRNGEIDELTTSPEQYRQLLAEPAVLERTQHFEYLSPVGGYRYIGWNEHRNGHATVFADKRVRQAMTMLIDRDRLIQETMLGYAVVATGPFSPLSKQCSPAVKPWPYDVDAAKRLLAEAGFADRKGDGVLTGPDGKPLEFKLTYKSGAAVYEKMVFYLKDAFAKAGVILDPDPLEWAVLIDRLRKKDFDAITLGWSASIEGDIFQMFHSTQTIAGGDNSISYGNPDLDQVIDKARHTVEEADRMHLWHRAHEILHEDQPYTFLLFPKSLIFLDKRFRNIHPVKLGLNPQDEWFVPREQQRWTK